MAKTKIVAGRRGFCCSGLLTGEVIRGQEPDWNDLAKKIHSLARPGSTPERRAAWEKLPKAEQEEMVTEFHERLTEALQAAKTDQRAPWLPVDKPVRHRYIEPGFRTLAMFDEIDSDGDGLMTILAGDPGSPASPEFAALMGRVFDEAGIAHLMGEPGARRLGIVSSKQADLSISPSFVASETLGQEVIAFLGQSKK